MSEWRYIVQRATTNEFLSFDVPLRRDELSWALSGAGSLRGVVAPDVGHLRAADGRLLLEEWGTLIYAEANGEVRWGGIVISSGFSGEDWTIEAAGFSTYPHGIPYTGHYSGTDKDPADIFRHIWEHVQSHPDGNLGVTVTGDSTKARLGTAGTPDVTQVQAEDGSWVPLSFYGWTEAPDGAVTRVVEGTPGEPYELAWWESPDCGSEMDNLARIAPFDFEERHRWNGDDIAHEVRIGYPRLGRRRDDLAFIQGDNITELVTPTIEGDDFANEVIGLGMGEGQAMLRRQIAVRDGRLRRPYVYTSKGIGRSATMDSFIRDELQRRRNAMEVSSITVADHPNAPIGSWALGDDILVQANLPWLGEIALWSRVVGWSLVSDDTAQLSLARSDTFRYGG